GAGGAVYATHPFGWFESSAAAVSQPNYRWAFPVAFRPWPEVLAHSPGDLTDVAATSRTSAWIVGSVLWHWDGNGWSSVPHAPGVTTFSAVAAVSSDDAW